MNQSFENKEAYTNKVDNRIYKTPGITLGSLFDGIGGFPYASSFYGIRPVWASEILPQAVSVTKRHFPQMKHVGDITKLDGAKLPPVDIITFGSPCQDLSTAGKRVGLSGERSGLFMEAIRIIDEMRRATNGNYPRYALWENVPGAMSSTRGRDFQAVLEAFTKTEIPMPLSGRWANAGMVRSDGVDLAWRVLNAQHFGVPQRRRRIFLVCDFGGESAGEILFIEESVRGNPAPGGEARKGTAADAQGSVGSADEGSVAFACNQRDEVRDLHDVSAAICAQPGMKQQTFIAKDVQCMNPWDTQQSRVFTGDGASPTLAGADGGGGRNPAGLVFCSASSQSHAGIAKELAGALTCQHEPPFVCEPELARTLTARGDSSPCADRGQNVVAVPASKECAGFCAGAGAEARSIGYERETAPTIKGGVGGFQMPTAVFNKDAVSVHQNGSGELSASNITKSLPTMSTSSCRNAPLVAQASGVTSKGNGDCFLSHECHCALTSGGGQAGQGYPALRSAIRFVQLLQKRRGQAGIISHISFVPTFRERSVLRVRACRARQEWQASRTYVLRIHYRAI